jgi:hypothetical protein
MRKLLALGGAAHFVIRSQVFGRCIHHAALVHALVRALPFAIRAVAISVIESPLDTPLVTLASDALPHAAYDCGAERAVATAPVVPAAYHEAGTTKRALPLDTDLEHDEPTPKKLAAAGAGAILRAP